MTRRFTKYPSNYVKASDSVDRKASSTRPIDFSGIVLGPLSYGDIVNVNGLEWRLCNIEKYPAAIHYKFINDDTGKTIKLTKTPGHPDWLRMSSIDGSLDEGIAINTILHSNKSCVYTHGLSYRNPTTYREPISKEEAIEIIKDNTLVDVKEESDVFLINTFSENDMW